MKGCPQSSVSPQSPIFNPQSFVIGPQTLILNPWSSILNPRYSILNPQCGTHNIRKHSFVLQEFTAFLLRMSRKAQHMYIIIMLVRIKFWIKSAFEDSPQLVSALLKPLWKIRILLGIVRHWGEGGKIPKLINNNKHECCDVYD